MKLDIPLSSGIELQFASGVDQTNRFPSAIIQKGIVLLYEGQDLSEEAVGFGVPILMRGMQTIFPSDVDLYLHGGCEQTRVSARFRLNLEEKISRNGDDSIENKLLYMGKNSFAAIIRHIPILRKFLTSTSNLLRSRLGWHTTYEQSDFSTYVVITYTVDNTDGTINVELAGGDFLSSSITEVILMNEQGAHHFNQYRDSNGTCQDEDEIGCWDPVVAEQASFIDQAHKVSFSLHQVQGARLYRGRELIEPRLAWSGFGYTFPPNLKTINYTLAVKKLP
jgi:hypothetical protein